MSSETYLEASGRELKRLKRIADQAIAQVPAKRFFSTLSTGENSIAIVMKHLGGNMRSRWTDFLDTDGEKSWRDRDSEFVVTDEDSRESILAAWEQGWETLLKTLAILGPADLNRVVTIRDESLTVLQAIHRQITHYAYHVGQLVLLSRHYTGETWTSLSVRRGESKQFNANPEKYL